MANYTLSSPPPGKALAEVGAFCNVNNVSFVLPISASPIRQNVSTAAQGSSKANFFLHAKIVG